MALQLPLARFIPHLQYLLQYNPTKSMYIYIYIPHKPLVQLEVLRLVQESVYAVYNPDWAGNVTTNGFQ